MKNFTNQFNLEEIASYDFTYDKWQAGSYSYLGLLNGHFDIDTINGHILIRKYAIGYCDAKRLFVRPKLDCIAVMFFKDGITFWSHLTKQEFNKIFNANIQ